MPEAIWGTPVIIDTVTVQVDAGGPAPVPRCGRTEDQTATPLTSPSR